MTALTLDASAALRVVLDGPKHRTALGALATADAVYAPDLYVAETANALWKYVVAKHIGEDSALDLHRDATAFVDRLVASRELFPEALTLAARTRHPVYDALYLVVARRTGSMLMTFDAKLAELARSLDIGVVDR